MEGNYQLYVPAGRRACLIHPRSAIVGDPQGDRITVDYQEPRENSNVQSFEDCIHHAAGRRAQNYPTVARASLPAEDLLEVGSVRYDATLRRWIIAEITDMAALEGWVPGPHVVGGSRALRNQAAGLRWSELRPHQQMRLHAMALSGDALAEGVLAEIPSTPNRSQPGAR